MNSGSVAIFGCLYRGAAHGWKHAAGGGGWRGEGENWRGDKRIGKSAWWRAAESGKIGVKTGMLAANSSHFRAKHALSTAALAAAAAQNAWAASVSA
jgi:hypothetical protein